MALTELLKKTDGGFKPISRIDDGKQWALDLRRRMQMSSPVPVMEVVALSPSRAAALLAANEGNRVVSDATVRTYASDIIAGRWAFNGEPIIISETGELNDGQHRCHAVIEANKAIEVLMVAGVSRASRVTTDMGKARNVGDFLHMHDIPDANVVAAVAAIVYAQEGDLLLRGGSRDLTNGHDRPTKQQILSFARHNLKDIKRAISAVDGKQAALVGTKSRHAAILALIGRRSGDWEEAESFVGAVLSGENLKRGSAALVARNRLLAEKEARSLSPIKTLEIMARAWNCHRAGASMSRVQLNGIVPELAV
jgi:hypothetical protein